MEIWTKEVLRCDANVSVRPVGEKKFRNSSGAKEHQQFQICRKSHRF